MDAHPVTSYPWRRGPRALMRPDHSGYAGVRSITAIAIGWNGVALSRRHVGKTILHTGSGPARQPTSR